MQIKCPECGFDRQVHESQIPATSSFATCPKCATRFRFRADPDAQPEASVQDSRAETTFDDKLMNESEDGDIWASMDKMRQEWDHIDREEDKTPHSAPASDSDEDINAYGDDKKREEAMRAYQQAAMQGGKIPFLSSVGSVPWEYKGGFLNPLAFMRTIILMVTRLPQFFSGINPYSSIAPAWLFLVVVRGVQMGVAIMGTQLISTMPDGSQQVLSIAEVFNVPVLIFMSVCMITLMHFIGSFIVNYTIQTHSRSMADFRLTFKVMAYANMPIMLSVIPGVGNMAGLFASLCMLLLGIRYAYGFSWGRAVLSILPYLLLSVLFLLMLIQAMSGGSPA